MEPKWRREENGSGAGRAIITSPLVTNIVNSIAESAAAEAHPGYRTSELHALPAWEPADAAALAAIAPVVADLYKLAFQVDTEIAYLLIGVGPTVWKEFGGSSAPTYPLWWVKDSVSAELPDGSLWTIFQEFKLDGEVQLGDQAIIMITEWF
jgi:hypothetical protein